MEILSVTIPILIFVGAGYILRQKNIIGTETRDFLSKLVYYFAFPALTFRSIVSFDFASTFKLALVAHNLTVTFIIFWVGFLLAFFIKDKRKRGSFCMGCFRSNQGYMGLPAIHGFYGEEAMSRAAVVSGFDSPLVILLSIMALEVFRGVKGNKTKSGLQIACQKLIGFVTNPFILSSALGLLFSYLNVPVLKFTLLDEFLKISSGLALPLALLSIGCSIEVGHLKNNIRLILATSAIKLLVMPAVAFVLAFYVFGFRDTNLGMSVILLSTPSSVSSYIMACEMDADSELSASIIGFTTFLSVGSISIIQFILGFMIK